ncbi:hypothetical protein [Candidatus Sororendozoicomonas aggregata]|uniref:hypothetical protein n=1 Tax=Candidatus Sororendozoicomonas aggregata TaxID=3073239 RepID=UPI002ED228D3
MKKSLIALAFALTASSNTFASGLDNASANVSMNVALYASITGLDDFALSTSGTDGSADAVYSGSDTYNLESNGQVRVTLSGGDLTNGTDSVATSYSLDGSAMTFDTVADSTHNQAHTVAASAQLGAISDQKAGAYAGAITLTVSGI